MVNIVAFPSSVEPTEIVYVNQLETDVNCCVTDTLRRKKEWPIKVACAFELHQKNKDSFLLEHNASFSLEGSFPFVSLFQDYLKKRKEELEFCLKKHTLIIKLNFKQKEVVETKKKEDVLDLIPINPRYNFNQIILPDLVREELMNALKVIQCKELVYNKWGFGEIDPIPRSILNFYGEPGTGKTMCAHAVANYLGKKILLLNYSEIESKYVGEAPKNLQKAFEIGEKTDAVLFFDEADSFLGKRIQNVTQGSEQALNSLRSQMLIQLEQYSGVVLFATNLVTNFDRAFESRILKHIRFELPNKEARTAIIRKMLPAKLPLSKEITDEDINQASAMIDGFSGREIKNAILDMLLSKASLTSDSIYFEPQDLFDAFEKKKEELKRLKEQEDKILKDKILKKLHEKNEEARVENELNGTESENNLNEENKQ